MSFLQMQYVDFDGDVGQTSIRVWDVADAADYATWRSGLLQLSSSLNAVSAGFQMTENHIISENDNLKQNAASPIAQKKTQMILLTQDTVTGLSYIERIPMPNLALADDAEADPAFIVTGTGANKLTTFNPEHLVYQTLKTNYDAVGRSPSGNPSTLSQAYIEE